MKVHLLLLTAFLGVTLCTCKKNTVTQVPLDPAFKAAFNFKAGSYWIYKDSISGRMDSFFVRRNSDEYLPSQATNTNTFVPEVIEMSISEYNISSGNDTAGWELDLEGTAISLSLLESKIYTLQIEYWPLVNYPFQTTLISPFLPAYSSVDTSVVIGINNSYVINGNTFTGVAEVNECAHLDSNVNGWLTNKYSYNDWFYICPDVGLIKIRLNHPQDPLYRVWELQRWVIIK